MTNPEQPSKPPEKAKSVLMLDDDSGLAETLKVFFETQGYVVTHVANGVEGLKKAMLKDYNVILCDMQMPNLAGDMFYTAMERVKPDLCKRFIFMTGYKADAKWDAFVRRVNGIILYKPFDLNILTETVQFVLKKTKQL